MNLWAIAIIFICAVFVASLIKLHLSKSSYSLADLITRDGKHLSTTKILQLIGGIVGTFIVIKMTITGTMTWDIFAIYLAYAASVDGFTKAINAKFKSRENEYPRYGYGMDYDYDDYRRRGNRKTEEVDGIPD